MTRFLIFNGGFIALLIGMQLLIPGFPWTICGFMVVSNVLGYIEGRSKDL